MDKNKIIIIILVIIIIALAALIGGFLFMNNTKDDTVIYNNTIDDVGTFNTTNVTNFTLDEESTNYKGTHYLANSTIMAEVTTFTQTYLMENTISSSEKVNDSPKGHTIYKTTSNIGDRKGEVRYVSFLTDNDRQRHIEINSEDYNLTCMMVDSFKMF